MPCRRQRDGFFKTTTGLKPADQNHGESQSYPNLKTFCALQCLQEDSADPMRNVCTYSANFRYTRHRQGFLPFLNRSSGNTSFRFHDYHHPAALRRF